MNKEAIEILISTMNIPQESDSNEPEIFEDDDDGRIPLVSESVLNSSPAFLSTRISQLKVQMAQALEGKQFAGLHPSYNIGSEKPEDQLRGLVLLRNFYIAEYCVVNRIFLSYRQLFYLTQASMTKNKEHVNLLELQMRPNCRLLEKIMMITRNSLPFFGRPEGFFALGKNVTLKIGGEIIGPANQIFQIPFGSNSVSGVGTFKTNASLIVFVESHAELSHLVSENILEKAQNTILLTSCGNADLGFSMVLSKLSRETNIPVRFLVDSDVGGMLIAATLAFGRFGYEFKDRDSFLTPYLQPLGILPADFLTTDLSMSDLSPNEIKGILTLKNKWESHGINLVRDQNFWLKVVRGFKDNAKKMSLAQMRFNRGADFISNRIVDAEKDCDRDEMLKMAIKFQPKVRLSRQHENEPYFK